MNTMNTMNTMNNLETIMNSEPSVRREYEDDVIVYGQEATNEKITLEYALRNVSKPNEYLRCASIANLWFAVVFLGCDYPDDVLEEACRVLLRVSEREFRLSVCRRFLDALERTKGTEPISEDTMRRRVLLTRIREMLP